VTKLAGENLCRVYGDEFDVPIVTLRYFSVYGPRQRPDMGYHRFINAILNGEPIYLTGDGSQVRGNTYISDCVDATLRAVDTVPGEVFNLGGGEMVSVAEVIRKIEAITGKKAIIEQQMERPGDQKYTGADISKLTRHTGWKPIVGIEEGLSRQIQWHLEQSQRIAA
jgi:nucleoside-diphosphate-sugar epimerase